MPSNGQLSTQSIQKHMGMLSIPHNDDKGGCCDPFSVKIGKKKQKLAVEDSDLAAEMNKLSFEERERVFEDIHGVSSVQEETPALIQSSIQALDGEITSIPVSDRRAYNKAVFLRPALQKDMKLKLQFLRAEEFNVEKAARRMVKFFGLKLDLFGEEKLVKRLALDDLTETELNLLKVGYMTLLPFCDRSGRPILFVDTTKLNFEIMTIKNIRRCLFFMKVACFEDESAQKTGQCTIMRFSGRNGSISKRRELVRRSADARHCFPGRVSSHHMCYDDPMMHLVLSTLRFGMDASTRIRSRTHYGSDMENDYRLLSFGIPTQDLLQKARSGEHTMFVDYLQKRRESDKRADALEAFEEARTEIILYPRPTDVLIGRGHPFRDLPCNIVWEKAIQDNFERHRDGSKFEKTCISMDIVKAVMAKGSRFLERTEQGWKALGERAARKKTAVAIRNRVRDAATAAAKAGKQSASRLGDHTSSDPKAKRQRFLPELLLANKRERNP